MGETLQVLKTKYQMALVSIRETEQERDDLKKQLEEQKRKSQQIEKSTKYLCETILKKKTALKINDDKDETPWFKHELPDMIKEAQSYLEEYFPSLQGMYDKLTKHNSRLIELNFEKSQELDREKEKIKELQNTINKKSVIIEQLKETIGSGQQNTVEMPDQLTKESGGNSSIAFVEEENDTMEEVIKESISPFYKAGEISVPIAKGPEVIISEKTAQATKSSLDKEIIDRQKFIADLVETLTEQNKLIIQIIGETGYSRMPYLQHYCGEKYPDIPKSRLTTGLTGISMEVDKDLDSKLDPKVDYIIEKRLSSGVAGVAKLAVFRLSFLGEDIYRFLFHKDPKTSEMTNLIRNHSTIDHGYGIANTAAVLGEFKFMKEMDGKVFFLTRRKDFTIQVSDKSSFIPDIVITYKGNNGKSYTDYFEYETGNCNTGDFIKKCNKIASVCRIVNIIVPSKAVEDETYSKALEWEKEVKEKGYSFKSERVIVRILSFDNLRRQTGIGSILKLEWDQIIEVRKGSRKK